MKAVYYKDGSKVSALFRVMQHEYSYLDRETGKWVPDAAVCDRVTFEAGCTHITEAEARQWVAMNAPRLSPAWV